MYNTSNEILIESTEIELLVTEGFTDKSKKILEEAIKKIKEFIRKVLTYIKSKLFNKAKDVDKAIKEVKDNGPKKVEEPIIVVSIKKLNNLLDSVDLVLSTAREVVFSTKDDLDKLIDQIDKDYYTMASIYEKYKGDIEEEYTGEVPPLLTKYSNISASCNKTIDSIKRCANDLEICLKATSTSTHILAHKKMRLISRTQLSIQVAIRAVEWILGHIKRCTFALNIK